MHKFDFGFIPQRRLLSLHPFSVLSSVFLPFPLSSPFSQRGVALAKLSYRCSINRASQMRAPLPSNERFIQQGSARSRPSIPHTLQL